MMLEDDSRMVAAELGRHPSLHRVCTSLHSLIVAERAAELLANPSLIPRRGGLWVPPSFMWAFPRIHVGHKGFNSEGDAVRLPVRVSWAGTPISIVTKGEQDEAWTYSGMGHTGVGSTKVTADNGVLDEFIPDGNTAPERGTVCLHYKSDLIRMLEDKVALGLEARWALMIQLEGYMESAVETAHRYVSVEVSHNGAPVLDETGRTSIVTTLMYGDDGSTEPSMVMRLLERCTLPSTFERVDPWRYMREAIASAAETAIRRAINDPHIGRKIRRLAAEMGTRDVDLVMAEYNERFPKDRLARKRADAALNAGSDVMASWSGLPELSEPGARR